MESNLLVGDRLFVTKFSYGYSKHSFPFSPAIFKGRLFYKSPKRGDVVVFKTPADNRTDYIISLPTSVKEINTIVESGSAKKKFIKNSFIKIKSYILDKNEKKLSKNDSFIILTEKEIQLLELFLKNTKPISKENILSSVWNYSSDADTHTVETHIYRLRKKIIDKFEDGNFILNNKDGYYL